MATINDPIKVNKTTKLDLWLHKSLYFSNNLENILVFEGITYFKSLQGTDPNWLILK